MKEIATSNPEKAAVLLRNLPPASLDKVMEMVGSAHAERLQSTLAAVSKRSDFKQLSVQVLDEFRQIQQEAKTLAKLVSEPAKTPAPVASNSPASTTTSAGHQSRNGATKVPESEARRPSSTEANSSSSSEQEVDFSSFDGADPLERIRRVSAPLLAEVLQKETPRVASVVLKQLPPDLTGGVLEKFDEDLREQVFVLVADNTRPDPSVIHAILTTIANVCAKVDPQTVGQGDLRLKTLTGILQIVEREERIRLMEVLAEHDKELATQIDDNLYDYSDVVRIQDRSVQKLLSQLEQKTVAMAIVTAPDEIKQKIIKNLSERVRAALSEEMELLGNVPASKCEPARKEIANTIRAQDKEGALMWVE